MVSSYAPEGLDQDGRTIPHKTGKEFLLNSKVKIV